jgi:hypothetical protein
LKKIARLPVRNNPISKTLQGDIWVRSINDQAELAVASFGFLGFLLIGGMNKVADEVHLVTSLRHF